MFECVEILLQEDNLITLKGNHDDWFADFLRTESIRVIGFMVA
ncbi:hypothetical protein [Parapedobacter soli]